MVIIHPAATRRLADIEAIQAKTGLQVTYGNRFLKLVPRTDFPPKAKKQAKPSQFHTFLTCGPGTGGDAA